MNKVIRQLSMLAVCMVIGNQALAASSAILVVKDKRNNVTIVKGSTEIGIDFLMDASVCYVGPVKQMIQLVQNAIDFQNANGGGLFNRQFAIESVSRPYSGTLFKNMHKIELSQSNASMYTPKESVFISECLE